MASASKAWAVVKSHARAYTGDAPVSLSASGEFVVAPCSERAAVLDLSSGVVRRTVQDSTPVRVTVTRSSRHRALWPVCVVAARECDAVPSAARENAW